MALYLGLFMGAGGAFFTIWVAPRLVPPGIEEFFALVAVAAVLPAGLQGLDA